MGFSEAGLPFFWTSENLFVPMAGPKAPLELWRLEREASGGPGGALLAVSILRQHYGHHQSPAIHAGGLIFCSGMLPVDPETGERRHGTPEAHVIFGNLKLLLESAGSSLDRLVQVHALIYDSIEYDVLNRVYRQYVANGPPARTVWTA
jgi:enamine deaminase RidA (YjgF/YER057c/UK114 family)